MVTKLTGPTLKKFSKYKRWCSRCQTHFFTLLRHAKVCPNCDRRPAAQNRSL